MEEWRKARRDAKCRRWRNKYAREQREIEEERREEMETKLDNAFIKCHVALHMDIMEEAFEQDKVVFDLARQLDRDLKFHPLTSEEKFMDELARRRAAMPKQDPAEVQEPIEEPDISLWTDNECFDASSGSEDFDLEELDYPGPSSKPQEQKPKPQSKPKSFGLSCSPPMNLSAPPPSVPRPVEPLPPLPEVSLCAYELVRLDRKEEIKAKFLEVFGIQ